MDDKVIRFHTPNQRSASEVLNEALDLELETVVIVGIGKDNTVHLSKSMNDSTLYLLGCLEAMKQHVYEKWE